jgi:hypothetical protein
MELIAVALIGGPLMWLLARLDRRNTQQHGSNMVVLERIENKVETLDTRLFTHIESHNKQNK